MAKYLLDTDILSEYLKGHDPTVARHAAAYARKHGIFCFTSITVHEIVFGLESKRATSQLKQFLAWLHRNEHITPTAADYFQAGIIRGKARKKGFVVELPDCLIAAVAARLGMPLVTGNTDDFEVIERTGIDLDVKNWREA